MRYGGGINDYNGGQRKSNGTYRKYLASEGSIFIVGVIACSPWYFAFLTAKMRGEK